MRTGRAFTSFLAVALVSAATFAVPAFALDPLVPPEVLAPADGGTVAAGSAPTFRVRTDAGDSRLWVYISRSSAPVNSCGTIDDDVGLIELTPTPDPAVYEATPTLYGSYPFWLNRAGTYYWQAYRIHYGGGGDGCIEAPVRSLAVTGVRPIEIGPQPLEPANGATLPTGPLTFRASALAGDADKTMWIHVSRSPQAVRAGGLIGFDAEIEPLTRTADPTVWSATPAHHTYSSFWMNTPGTYYWQPHRISSFGDPDGFVEGPVRSFTLVAAPPSTPAAPTTIRGDEAFTRGTANDLYLACTKLDLYLVDVLPAGRTKVSVTGAADLRLRGRTLEILLDGRRVGRAVVRSTGAFAATVRAPKPARRSRARFQARFGSTRSQNLKLQRRMVAARLSRSGKRFTLTGRITKPFAKRPAAIGIQRYLSCGRVQRLPVKRVRPTSSGRFTVTFAVPSASVRALMYRALTKVARRPGGKATSSTYTLPRAVTVG